MQLSEDRIIQNLREETKIKDGVSFLNPAQVGILLGLVAVGAITFGLRAIYLNRSFDVFIDEITYLRITQNVAANLQLALYGQPFFLHPPAFFYLAAGFLHMVNPPSDTLQQIYTLRLLNVIFATLTNLCIFLGVRYIANWKLGLAASAIFAIEQFVIKMNSMVMLETTAVGWVVAGYCVLITGANKRTIQFEGFSAYNEKNWGQKLRVLPGGLSRPQNYLYNRIGLNQPLQTITLRRTIPAGILFGLALLTKDMTAFLTLVPLGICFVLNWSLNRRNCIQVSIAAVATYLVYPLSVFLTGSWDEFANVKLHGLFRLTGAVKETGMTQGNRPSFIQVLIQNIDKSGTTYLLIIMGAFATCFVVFFGNKIQRLVVTWSGSSYILMVFCVLAGSLEEQFFYFLIVSSIVSIALGLGLLFEKRRNLGKLFPALLVGAVVIGIFYFGDNLYQWQKIHLVPNNGYAQVLDYMHQNLPVGTRVAATSETAQFLFEDYKSGPFGKWSDPQDLGKNNAQYLLISLKQLNWDQRATSGKLLNWVNENGALVYRFNGEGDGPLLLYRLDK